eukprot:13621099-Ditylum_brightwellii.AAC.1
MGLYPKWYYFNKPTNMAFHNLTSSEKTSSIPVQQIKSLLGLGLKYRPTPRYTTRKKLIRDTTLMRFRRNLLVKGYYAGQELPANNNFNKKMYIASTWEPPPWTIPWQIDQRTSDFETDVQQLYTKKQAPPNLLPTQLNTLSLLQKNNDILVVQCDKNLGPTIIKTKTYIKKVLDDHLHGIKTYRQVPQEAIQYSKNKLLSLMKGWMLKYDVELNHNEKKNFKSTIKHNKNPLP